LEGNVLIYLLQDFGRQCFNLFTSKFYFNIRKWGKNFNWLQWRRKNKNFGGSNHWRFEGILRPAIKIFYVPLLTKL